jgi:hypothetical protein
MAEWSPDIVDYSIIDEDKAKFIYDSASDYLKDTIKLSDDRERKAFGLLSVLIAVISALLSYILLNCNFNSLVCGSGANSARLFWPSSIISLGLIVSAFMVAMGCLKPQMFNFSENETCNLLRNDLCAMPVQLIKVSGAIQMQQRINENKIVLLKSGLWLNRAILTVILAVFAGAIVALAPALILSLKSWQIAPSAVSPAPESGLSGLQGRGPTP